MTRSGGATAASEWTWTGFERWRSLQIVDRAQVTKVEDLMDPLKNVASFVPARQAFSLWEEFKAFAFKGNVIDLAVGVIIGAAFAKIVDALVKSIIMPLVSVILPAEQSYVNWKWVINGKDVPYGVFIGEVVNFLIVALALFLFIVKFVGWMMRARKAEVAAAPPLTKDQELLTEIRDLLQKQPRAPGPAPAV
jgi:large conductance mechanosensitive channel